MSQSHPREPDHHAEVDPLLAFNAELAAAESTPKPVVPTPPKAAPQSADVAPLGLRLDQAERSLDRARIEISSLKSDLATLVTAVDDIKKRLSRRHEPVAIPSPVRVPPRRGFLRVAAVVIFCLTMGAAIWALASGMIEIPEPPTPADVSVGQPPRESGSSLSPVTAPLDPPVR